MGKISASNSLRGSSGKKKAGSSYTWSDTYGELATDGAQNITSASNQVLNLAGGQTDIQHLVIFNNSTKASGGVIQYGHLNAGVPKWVGGLKPQTSNEITLFDPTAVSDLVFRSTSGTNELLFGAFEPAP